jgi:hypothetical protein
LNLVAADVSPLHLKGRKVRADSRRLLQFRGSEREFVVGRILTPSLSPSDGERAVSDPVKGLFSI